MISTISLNVLSWFQLSYLRISQELHCSRIYLLFFLLSINNNTSVLNETHNLHQGHLLHQLGMSWYAWLIINWKWQSLTKPLESKNIKDCIINSSIKIIFFPLFSKVRQMLKTQTDMKSYLCQEFFPLASSSSKSQFALFPWTAIADHGTVLSQCSGNDEKRDKFYNM